MRSSILLHANQWLHLLLLLIVFVQIWPNYLCIKISHYTTGMAFSNVHVRILVPRWRCPAFSHLSSDQSNSSVASDVGRKSLVTLSSPHPPPFHWAGSPHPSLGLYPEYILHVLLSHPWKHLFDRMHHFHLSPRRYKGCNWSQLRFPPGWLPFPLCSSCHWLAQFLSLPVLVQPSYLPYSTCPPKTTRESLGCPCSTLFTATNAHLLAIPMTTGPMSFWPARPQKSADDVSSNCSNLNWVEVIVILLWAFPAATSGLPPPSIPQLPLFL